MRGIRTRSPLTRPGVGTSNEDVTDALSLIGLGTSAESNGRAGPARPVGTVNGTTASPWSLCRRSAKSRLTPQSAAADSDAANGVVFEAGTPNCRSGHGEEPCVIESPGVEPSRLPATPVRPG